jgi:diguanylate cyclase (GGDEF)-like protein/excisionase family DNA binding protein
MSAQLPPRPIDATLTVTKAARLLGVHPNTIRAWSDAGRLRYYRINPRGDRRYRMGDLQRFLAAAEGTQSEAVPVSSIAARRPFDPVSLDAFRTTRLPRPTLLLAEHGAAEPSEDEERHRRDLALLDSIATGAFTPQTIGDDLRRVAEAIRAAGDRDLVVIWERRGDRLVPQAAAVPPGVAVPRLYEVASTTGVLGAALALVSRPSEDGGTPGSGTALSGRDARVTTELLPDASAELAAPIPGRDGPWGVLLVVAGAGDTVSEVDRDLVTVLADAIGAIVGVVRREDEVGHLLHRAEALRRVAGDIGGRLELDRILAGLVDHAMVLFEGDRAAVFLQQKDGRAVAEVSRNLSSTYLAAVKDFPRPSLPADAIVARRPLFAVGYRDDPRGSGVRAAVVQEGFDTVATAPLFDGDEVLGLLNVYHDAPHVWSSDELDTMAALAIQASVAIRTAQNYEKMATWTAQLQSIQQLGARLNHLSNTRDIGLAIATELRQLIDYHNVRVYRVHGNELIPVALRGQVGEYVDETPEQLKVAIGEGITGWVAQHRIAQYLPDASVDPRANTIPGTEDDLDESMLLAPMLFEDDVLGVVVLSKLGLHQFSDDDLRLLVIYASFAAQAMANADTTERLREQSAALERQLRSQKELIQITESILTTLDARAVLDGITERLSTLIACDNIAIEIIDPSTGLLTPLTARGVHAEAYLEPWAPGETGVATWVVEHNEPAFIVDERTDERVNHFRLGEVEDIQDGSLIVVPLRGRSGATGVLTIERLGVSNAFTNDEFDLVQLFAAQVSIALQNAEVYRAVEIRAQTDGLTGLLNHATFEDHLERAVHDATSFGLIMLDLDDFREINNRMGHQAGDEALRQIAKALIRSGRDSDLVFRYGGDEFAFLLPHTDAAGAIAVAERAHHAVRALGGPVTASVGVATFPIDGGTAAEVLLAADRACFLAKRSGRDRVATAAEGLALATEFRQQAPTPVDSEAQVA